MPTKPAGELRKAAPVVTDLRTTMNDDIVTVPVTHEVPAPSLGWHPGSPPSIGARDVDRDWILHARIGEGTLVSAGAVTPRSVHEMPSVSGCDSPVAVDRSSYVPPMSARGSKRFLPQRVAGAIAIAAVVILGGHAMVRGIARIQPSIAASGAAPGQVEQRDEAPVAKDGTLTASPDATHVVIAPREPEAEKAAPALDAPATMSRVVTAAPAAPVAGRAAAPRSSSPAPKAHASESKPTLDYRSFGDRK
jgi:hypothetical protein